jgi:hypothetical protein
VICGRNGFSGAKASPEILPHRHFASLWQISGRRFGPRSGACDPATKARKRFNTHRVRSGSVQCILSAVLRHDSCRTPEELSGRSTTDRILNNIGIDSIASHAVDWTVETAHRYRVPCRSSLLAASGSKSNYSRSLIADKLTALSGASSTPFADPAANSVSRP